MGNVQKYQIPDLARLDVLSLTRAYQAGSISPVEVTRAVLEHAAAIQPRINAFTFFDAERALQSAAAAENRWKANQPLSPIDGVPTTIKDIVHVKGWTVRYGSKVTDAEPMRDDAPSVSRLRSSGAVFIGQTTTPEFGWKAVTDSPEFGITRNPWDEARTPGGSSGGAAAAAACGAGVLHLGTDGGGSIRIPAAFTGIVGHKPTFGRVAAYPPSVFGTVAHIGPMARTVRDAALMLDVMSGRDVRDWAQPISDYPSVEIAPTDWVGKRVGYWRTPCVGGVDPATRLAVEKVLKDLEKAGAEITEIALPDQTDLLEVFYRHWYVGAANRLASLNTSQMQMLDEGFVKAARVGERYTAVDRLSAETARGRYIAAMDALLVKYDLIMSPTVPNTAFDAGYNVPPDGDFQSWPEWSSFSFPINLSQQPACSVPCGLSQDGMPIGLQIIGSRGRDGSVLSAALAYQEMYPNRFLMPDTDWPFAENAATNKNGTHAAELT